MHLGRCATIRGSAPDQCLPFPASPETAGACPVPLEKPAGPQRPNRGRQLDLARLRELPSRRACVYSRCSSPWNLSRPRGSGAASVLGLHHGISSFISPGSDGGGGGGAATAGREAEGRRMRIQSTAFPPIVVRVGYSSIRCPGQSSVSGKPVALQTASKFVAFNGSDLGTFSK